MSRLYFTIAGTDHFYGKKYFEPEMKVKLIKEPENEFDSEAIRVELSGLGKVGYVANSSFTVMGESMSAGRLYDKIEETAEGKVLYVIPNGVLCYIEQEPSPED